MRDYSTNKAVGKNPQTRAAQIIAAFTKLGWVERTDYVSRKYRCFEHAQRPYKYFVGRNGAIRYGASASNSSAMFGGDLAKQDKWLADVLQFVTIGHTLPKPRVAHRDEDIA